MCLCQLRYIEIYSYSKCFITRISGYKSFIRSSQKVLYSFVFSDNRTFSTWERRKRKLSFYFLYNSTLEVNWTLFMVPLFQLIDYKLAPHLWPLQENQIIWNKGKSWAVLSSQPNVSIMFGFVISTSICTYEKWS